MDKPKTYRVQDGCHNCRHRFEESDPECGPNYYCAFGAEPPPPSLGAIPYDEEKWDVWFEAWDTWSDGRAVDEAGICENYVESPPTTAQETRDG